MGRPPKVEARDTRQHILDAALELFAEEGFHGTSMREIARAVGVRESALYHHFASKDAILAELLHIFGPSKLDQLKAMDLDAIIAMGVDRVLRMVIHRVLDEWASPKERKFARVMMAEAPRLAATTSIHLPGAVSEAVQAFAGLFKRLMAKGAVRDGDPELFATEWMGPLFMLRVRFMIVNPGPVNLRKVKALADRHVDFFWQGIRPGGRP